MLDLCLQVVCGVTRIMDALRCLPLAGALRYRPRAYCRLFAVELSAQAAGLVVEWTVSVSGVGGHTLTIRDVSTCMKLPRIRVSATPKRPIRDAVWSERVVGLLMRIYRLVRAK